MSNAITSSTEIILRPSGKITANSSSAGWKGLKVALAAPSMIWMFNIEAFWQLRGVTAKGRFQNFAFWSEFIGSRPTCSGIQRSAAFAHDRHLKVCAPDNDLVDKTRTLFPGLPSSRSDHSLSEIRLAYVGDQIL